MGRNDDFYNRFLIKNDLIGPVLEVAVQEKLNDNLLGSACLEFFEFIRGVGSFFGFPSFFFFYCGTDVPCLTSGKCEVGDSTSHGTLRR